MSSHYGTEFVEAGTLAPPRWIGRLVRLLVGLWLLKLFYDLFYWELWVERSSPGLLSSSAPDDPLFWVLVALFFCIFPHVVNIGFGVDWGSRPQLVLVGLLVAAFGHALWAHGGFWSAAVGWVLLLWILYVALHLGVSFVLAAILGTPGCEMRAIPHAGSLLAGDSAPEHFCPGFLDPLDRWERRRAAGRAP